MKSEFQLVFQHFKEHVKIKNFMKKKIVKTVCD